MIKSNAFNNDKEDLTAAFGIDLGTTNSAISVIKKGRMPEVIELTDGRKTMPSCVLYNEDGTVTVGKEAYNMRYLPNAIYSVKKHMQDTRYKVLGKTPAEVSSEILKRLVELAGKDFGKIKDVTITVPAYFDQNGIRATEEAAKLADLNVLSILREPTSAAIEYSQGSSKNKVRQYLIFDFGGGTFDVSAICIIGEEFELKVKEASDLYGINYEVETDANKDRVVVMGIGGDNNLGGDDVDIALVNIALSKVRVKRDSLTNEQYEKLLLQAESIKKGLQIGTSYTLRIKDEIEVGMGYSDLVKATEEVANRMIAITSRVIRETGISTDTMFLVGGSTKSLALRELLRDAYPELNIVDALNPDESVANGAAIKAYADKFDGNLVTVFDVIPLNIGIDASGYNDVIIKGSSQVPVAGSKQFTTVVDGQKQIALKIIQGNTKFSGDCVELGEVRITDLPDRKAGELTVTVSISINSNNLLKCVCSYEDVVKELELDLKGVSAGVTEEKPKHRFTSRWLMQAQKMTKDLGDQLVKLVEDLNNGIGTVEEINEFIKNNK